MGQGSVSGTREAPPLRLPDDFIERLPEAARPREFQEESTVVDPSERRGGESSAEEQTEPHQSNGRGASNGNG